MAKRCIYICENEYGNDPCEFAKAGREISDSDFEIKLDIDTNPVCPGKTLSGKDCGQKLRFLREEGGGLKKRLIVGGGVLAALVLVAVAGYWMLGSGGNPLMEVEPASLTFPRAEAGTATASLRIRNSGDGELIIERIEANPSAFSTSEASLHVEPKDAQTLMVHFKSPSAEMTEGELLLYSNSQNSPITIRLIANQDPWWVYRKLEKSSKILSTEP